MVTILSLTQITELKLLLDIGRQGHRFYDFVMTMLIACISLELLIGIIVIYVGNLHYYQQQERGSGSTLCSFYGLCRLLSCLCCRCRCCSDPGRCCRRHSSYRSVTEVGRGGSSGVGKAKKIQSVDRGAAGAGAVTVGLKAPTAVPEPIADDEELGAMGCCGVGSGLDEWEMSRQVELSTLVELEQADIHIEASRIKAADADLRIVRTGNYMRVIEEAIRRSAGGGPGSSAAHLQQQQQHQLLEEELATVQTEHSLAVNDKKEAEAEKQMAEARQRQAFYARELATERRERVTFRKLSRWQHAATYLLYFVMLMNVFVTTFGISGSSQDLFVGAHNAPSFSSWPTTTLTSAAAAPLYIKQGGLANISSSSTG